MGQSFFAASEPFVYGLAGPERDAATTLSGRTVFDRSDWSPSPADHQPEDDRALAAMLGTAVVAGLGFWIGLFVVIF